MKRSAPGANSSHNPILKNDTRPSSCAASRSAPSIAGTSNATISRSAIALGISRVAMHRSWPPLASWCSLIRYGAPRMPSDDLLTAIRAIVGDRGLLTGADTAAYVEDWRHLYRGRTPAVVRPATTDELVHVVRLCAEARAPIVPQGGNTSMVGGAMPNEDGSRNRRQSGADQSHPRHRSARHDDDHRSGRDFEGGAGRRGRSRLPAAVVDLIRRQRADRRRARRERRWQQHRALRQRARSRAWPGGRVARRHGLEWPAPAAQRQHRLLPASVVRRFRRHAWHHHRGRIETGPAATRTMRSHSAPSRHPRPRSICSAAFNRTTPRRSARSN